MKFLPIIKIFTVSADLIGQNRLGNDVFYYLRRRRFNAAATPRLGSTQLGLNKHNAAVIINKEMKTTISKFPRSNPNHFYEFQRFEILGHFFHKFFKYFKHKSLNFYLIFRKFRKRKCINSLRDFNCSYGDFLTISG